MVIEDATDAAIVAGLEQLSRDPEDSGTFVVLEGDATRNYYVQFSPVGEQLLCEAVSNAFLDPADQLGERQHATLAAVGWHAPEEGGNWTCWFAPGPAGYAAIIALVHRTFADVWDEPPEGALFEYMSDLDQGNQWLTVQRFDAPFDRFRVSVTATPEHFDVDVLEGAESREQRGVPFRAAHAKLTDWAFGPRSQQ
ncbi:hypothetical protein OJ997_11855 [Solirubrobacter phytolaccae]|uniref:TY-Chap N-terminal domain-containing protein n=1 Tax=Solirubrobacter phytolaccae TaxID=1404360 RepID=A0A9X3SF48_9ACTN|nr:hypothetical protein [Solirubrobacter phytolaccae]MDA0180992.1 hypothetical protein [Solirubrobacter phytolaccae]